MIQLDDVSVYNGMTQLVLRKYLPALLALILNIFLKYIYFLLPTVYDSVTGTVHDLKPSRRNLGDKEIFLICLFICLPETRSC